MSGASKKSDRGCLLAAASLAVLALLACRANKSTPAEKGREHLELSELLGQGAMDSGFERATGPRRFTFPNDHGPHPSFRSEWWYLTGNLLDNSGRRFGYQLTIFRSALTPRTAARASHWAATDVYMGNFALTDVEEGRFYAFDRFERAAIGLAGASSAPLQIWVDNWSMASTGSEAFPARIEAQEGALHLELLVRQGTPPVLQGDQGLSQKGPGVGNASYYYSLPRMPTEGLLRIGDRAYHVEGLSWMDREWSTSSLSRNQVGWDWFALQLNDGRELMYYQLRQADGQADAFSSGALIQQDGSWSVLTRDQVELEVISRWRSSKDGRTYPSGWKLRVPSAQWALEVRPFLPDQELDLAVRYWEGAVGVTGNTGQKTITGSGYAELTGYGP